MKKLFRIVLVALVTLQLSVPLALAQTTDNLGIRKVQQTQASKEVTINDGLTILDRAIAGRLQKTLSASSTTLTGSESVYAIYDFTGTLAADSTVLMPATGSVRKFTVFNNTAGGYSVTVKTTASGSTGVAVTSGQRRELYHDGTNVADAITVAGTSVPNATTTVPGLVTTSTAGSTVAVTNNDPKLATVYYASVFASLSTALTAIGSTQATLVIDTPYTVTSDITFPTNVTVTFTNYGKITSSGASTGVALNEVQAPMRQQILASAMGGKFGMPGPVSAGWFGATDNGATDDDQPALQLAVDSIKDDSALIVPAGWKLKLGSTLKINNKLRFQLVGEAPGGTSGYAGKGTQLIWGGSARGTMVELINSNSCAIRNLGFDMAGYTPANCADVAIDSGADYPVVLTGAAMTAGNNVLTFTGLINGSGVFDSYPNGQPIHRTRQIVVQGVGPAGTDLTTTVASIITPTSQITVGTNASTTVPSGAGKTATIAGQAANPYSSSSHIFEHLYITWGSAIGAVAGRVGIRNDYISGQNHERVRIRDTTVYGNGGPSATTSANYGAAISFGASTSMGDTADAGGNVLQSEVSDCFVYGMSYGIKASASGLTATRIQGSYLNKPFYYKTVRGVIQESRFEYSQQFFYGSGNVAFLSNAITSAYTGYPFIQVSGGTSRIKIENLNNDAGGIFSGTGIKTAQCEVGTACYGDFWNNDQVDQSQKPDVAFSGFQTSPGYFSDNYFDLNNLALHFSNGWNVATFGALPADDNGTIRWCQDCQQVDPCTGAGTGAWARRIGGVWRCSDPGSLTASLIPSLDASKITTGAFPNARLANSSVTINTGNGLSGGGAVALGGSLSLSRTTYAARATHDADQSTSTGVAVTVALNTEHSDTASIHDTATNNERLTAPVAGYYVITGAITWDGAAGGQRTLYLRYNGSDFIDIAESDVPGANRFTQTVHAIYYLNAGDYVDMRAVQSSGGTVAIKNMGGFGATYKNSPALQMVWQGP